MEGLSGLSVQGDGMLRERGCVGALEHLGRVDHSPGGAGEEALERVALVQDREELTQAVDHLREVDVDLRGTGQLGLPGPHRGQEALLDLWGPPERGQDLHPAGQLHQPAVAPSEVLQVHFSQR